MNKFDPNYWGVQWGMATIAGLLFLLVFAAWSYRRDRRKQAEMAAPDPGCE